ncbi:P-loop containing nucleoside triphosphate hydrolase protein [Suillus paluster]|uniref:P-loop containing nucleoside triphosphate hydrolase protein n=1 Tax=Suillus paluster TaxID=48578 RepID=UPI001B875068|nr:P-loop containing nucleoside triphosphate hydrolase protein [Suillus paluster]KAG1738631.1 P-loop containing nucleoside triphosphate hydrolase protein [Suillus paluster]
MQVECPNVYLLPNKIRSILKIRILFPGPNLTGTQPVKEDPAATAGRLHQFGEQPSQTWPAYFTKGGGNEDCTRHARHAARAKGQGPSSIVRILKSMPITKKADYVGDGCGKNLQIRGKLVRDFCQYLSEQFSNCLGDQRDRGYIDDQKYLIPQLAQISASGYLQVSILGAQFAPQHVRKFKAERSFDNKNSLIEELALQRIPLSLYFPSSRATSSDSVIVWDRSERMILQIMTDFPTKSQEYPSSLASKILDNLSISFLALPIRFLEAEISSDFISHHRGFIEGALPLLCALSTMKFAGANSFEDESDVEDIEPDDEFFKKKVHQKMRKRNRRKAQRAVINISHFARLDVAVPTTSDAAAALSIHILAELKEVLSKSLPQMLRLNIRPPEDAKSSSVQPIVQPMKAALYFDNCGWVRRVADPLDREIFKIIFKTIRHLSRGHFSSDNQKRLDGTDAGIPVFEAKLTKDLRLVYQIDYIPDQDGESERQDASSAPRRPTMLFCQPHSRWQNPCQRSQASPLDLSPNDMEHLHSLLVLEKYVTVLASIFAHPQEQKVVECTTSCYVLGRSGTGKTTTMLFKILGIQRAWESSGIDMPKPRQIFVTKYRTLATKAGEYFSRFLESLALADSTLQELAKLKAQSILDDLVDIDDVPESQMNIPMRYSQLEDKHFPLFVTFDQLAKMIAADVFDMDDPETRRSAELFFNTDDARAHDSCVTYDVFKNQYWPHFPQGLTKNLNSWLVFSEFMGIIEGSEQALSCPDGVLDRSSYIRFTNSFSPISGNQRNSVYRIFEIYQKFKKQKNHFDVADRYESCYSSLMKLHDIAPNSTHAILKVLGNQRFPGRQIDYLYVDEAQDHLLIDVLDGLFWAGDTAQTISAGSSFRFEDLKAFIYRMEVSDRSKVSRSTPLEFLRSQTTVFQLGMNSRSHGGIANCAHSVIELITKFWPSSIDFLQPEKGVVDGVKPIFFTGLDRKRFLTGNRTLYENKGLEFNDMTDSGQVLLYNFFEDSVIDASRWRVILNGVESRGYAPDFYRDETRYAGICSELKLLYVGITRARKNMWIFDKSDKSDAMHIFWTSRNLVQNCARGSDVPPLAVSSTPEEWASSGCSLFLHKRYLQAIHCFQRAGLLREVKVCEAYLLRVAARSSVGVALLNVQQKAFITAADAFADCGAAATGNEKRQYYRTSADCYVRGGEDVKAADTYLEAQEFGLAAQRYRKAGSFHRTLRVLTDHSKMIPEETATGLWTACRLYYCRNSNNPAPLPLFSSSDEELEFLKANGLDYARFSSLTRGTPRSWSYTCQRWRSWGGRS